MLSRNRYVSWFAQFRKELSLVESVHPAEMKLCPGFHKSFASKQTTVAVQQFVFWCQEEVNSPSSAKTSRLSRAHCGAQSFTSCAKAFRLGALFRGPFWPSVVPPDRASEVVSLKCRPISSKAIIPSIREIFFGSGSPYTQNFGYVFRGAHSEM